MRRYKGTFGISFGIEHRMRKEEMDEQPNKESQAMITGESAGSEDYQHTSGGVDSNLGKQSLTRKREQCQALVNVRGGMPVLCRIILGAQKDGLREMKR